MHEREGHALPTAQHPLVLTKAERIVLWLFHSQLPGLLTKDSLCLQVPLREFNCSTRLRATDCTQCSSYSSLYCWPWQPVVPVTCCGILVQLFQVKPAVHWAVWNHLCCEFAMCASAMWLIRTIYALHVVCSNGNLLYKNYIYKSTLVSELDPQIIEKGGGSSS